MSRNIQDDALTALEQSTVRPFYLFEADFAGGTLYYNSTDRDLVWDETTWLGNGTFLGLSSIRENTNTEATGIDIVLNSVSSAIISALLTYSRQGLIGSVYLGLFDASWNIIVDPILLFSGGLDVPKISDARDQITLTLSYESAMILLKKSKDIRYTDAQQQQMYPGDKGFEFVSKLSEISVFWGVKDKKLG